MRLETDKVEVGQEMNVPGNVAKIGNRTSKPRTPPHCKKTMITNFTVLVLRTGCSITPCRALSQASCRSPDDRRGAALPPEDVGGHVGVNHTQKVSRKGGNGNHSG